MNVTKNVVVQICAHKRAHTRTSRDTAHTRVHTTHVAAGAAYLMSIYVHADNHLAHGHAGVSRNIQHGSCAHAHPPEGDGGAYNHAVGMWRH